MNKENLLKLDGVCIVVKGKQVVFTPDEARRIRDELVELLGPKIGTMPYYEQQPIWIDPNSEEWPNKWSLTQSGSVVLTINI